MQFYNNDHSFTTVAVEKNLRTIDLCELLKVKRNAIGIAWSIVETWPKLGIGMYTVIIIIDIDVCVWLLSNIYYLSSRFFNRNVTLNIFSGM